MLIYGINPVLEALKAGRVREVRIDGARRARAGDVCAAAAARGVPVRVVPAPDLVDPASAPLLAEPFASAYAVADAGPAAVDAAAAAAG
ncbi:MAG TPA: RNA methyltransferase substrate-binding domain-containing protein, partial [Vicinamibacterales bacterium]|nr:RNA methyltransferase substrate-binding domain-containing protein [Vicinamibacterales bacterium]